MNTPQVVTLNGEGNLVDEFGNEFTGDFPKSKINRLESDGGCFRMHVTQTGKRQGQTQWRWENSEYYNRVAAEAEPINETQNTTEMNEDIVNFIEKSVSLRPDSLIMSNIKWKYLIRSVIRGKNVMMTGPSGCGKTLAVMKVAEAFENRQFFYFNLGATTDPRSTLVGNTHFSKDNGTFVAEALFVKAIQTENSIILLDELTRANPDAWNILMSVLDENQRYLRIDEHPETPTIKVAEGVTFIATANIGIEYTATRVLDRAMRDRFSAIIEMEPLSQEDEFNLLTRKFPDLPVDDRRAIAEIAAVTREQVNSDDPKVSQALSSRQTVEMAGNMYDGFTLAEAAEVCVYPNFSSAGGADSERTFMRQLVQKWLPTESLGEDDPWTRISSEDDNPAFTF